MPKGKPRAKKEVVKEDVTVKVERLNLSDTPKALTREDYRAISDATEGYLKPAEANLLWNTAENHWNDDSQWVEIGSLNGKSSVLLGGVLALHGVGWLQCVDPMEGDLSFPSHYTGALLDSDHLSNVGSTVEAFKSTIAKAGIESFVSLVQRKSTEHVPPNPVNLIFFDGLHDLDSVKADWEHYKKFLTPNAIVIYHDYQKWHGPTLVVDTAIAYNELQFIEQADSLVVCRYIGAK